MRLLSLFKSGNYRAAAVAAVRGYRFAQLQHTPFFSGLGDSAWMLYALVRSLKPAVCVEIGSARGKSACFIGQALKDNNHGKLFAIDPHDVNAWNDAGSLDTYPVLRENLRRLNVADRVEIIRKTSADAAANWGERSIDLLFIDGDHSYEGVKKDWDLFSPHVSKFGVVLFHDTIWEVGAADNNYRRQDMGVPQFTDELRRKGYPVITLPNDCGLSMVQPLVGGVPLL